MKQTIEIKKLEFTDEEVREYLVKWGYELVADTHRRLSSSLSRGIVEVPIELALKGGEDLSDEVKKYNCSYTKVFQREAEERIKKTLLNSFK